MISDAGAYRVSACQNLYDKRYEADVEEVPFGAVDSFGKADESNDGEDVYEGSEDCGDGHEEEQVVDQLGDVLKS